MTLDEAVALIRSQEAKTKENYLCVEFSYNKSVILDWKSALAFLTSLKQAEAYTESYSEPGRFDSFSKDDFKMTIWTPQQYEDRKVAALLKVSIKEFEKLRDQTEDSNQ